MVEQALGFEQRAADGRVALGRRRTGRRASRRGGQRQPHAVHEVVHDVALQQASAVVRAHHQVLSPVGGFPCRQEAVVVHRPRGGVTGQTRVHVAHLHLLLVGRNGVFELVAQVHNDPCGGGRGRSR